MTNQVSLTDEQVETLLKAERLMHDLLPQLDKLQSCGKDCTALREKLVKQQMQSQMLRQHFGPTANSMQHTG